MSSVREILQAFYPILEQAEARLLKNETTPLDQRIGRLVAILRDGQNAGGSERFDDFNVVNTHISYVTTLSDLKTVMQSSPQITDLFITYLNLQQNIEKIRMEFSVAVRVQQVAESVLQQVSLYELQLTGFILPLKDSPVWYALATDEAFLKRQVCELKNCKVNMQVIGSKIKDIACRNPDLFNVYSEVPFRAPWIFGKLELPIGKLRFLSGEELNSIAKKLPAKAGSLLTDSQIASLNFSLFSGEVLDKMIEGDGTEEDINRRFDNLHPAQIEVFLTKTSGCLFPKFSDCFYRKLPLSVLTKKQAEAMFDDHCGLKTEQVVRRLHLIPSQEILNGLHLLPEKFTRMLPDIVYQKLRLSSLTKKQVEAMFDDHYGMETGKALYRLQLIAPEEILNGLHLLPEKFTRMLPDSFYQGLPLSTLTKRQVEDMFDDHYGMETDKAVRHLHLVAPQEISKGFHLLPEKLMTKLSLDQFSSLDYSQMSENQIKSLLSSYLYSDKEEYKKRIQAIQPRFINDVIKIKNDIIAFLSVDQYRALDIALFNEKMVKNLFPGFTTATLHPGYTYTIKDAGPYGQRHEFTHEGKGFSSMSGYSKTELENKLQANKEICLRMAANFSCGQLRAMIPLMHPECQDLISKKA